MAASTETLATFRKLVDLASNAAAKNTNSILTNSDGCNANWPIIIQFFAPYFSFPITNTSASRIIPVIAYTHPSLSKYWNFSIRYGINRLAKHMAAANTICFVA